MRTKYNIHSIYVSQISEKAYYKKENDAKQAINVSVMQLIIIGKESVTLKRTKNTQVAYKTLHQCV